MRVLGKSTWNRILRLPKDDTQLPEIELNLSGYLGNPIQTAENHAVNWVSKFNKITRGIPNLPPIPTLSELSPGWNVYEGNWKPSPIPTGTIVFDTETHGRFHQMPILGVAVSRNNWYIWVSHWALGQPYQDELIPLSPNGLVIAHNASFDIARTENAYLGNSPDWIDTMSLVQCVNGLPRSIVNLRDKTSIGYLKLGCGVSLLDAVNFWVKDGSATITQADKSLRNFFAECQPTQSNLTRLHENWEKLVGYAFNDVKATFHLFRIILPEYRQICPRLISLMASSIMLRAQFPISDSFQEWVNYCDSTFKSKEDRINQTIQTIVSNTPDNGESDIWLCHLDWYRPKSGKNAGVPRWRVSSKDLTIRSRILPYLLRLTWNGHPIQHSKELGWHFVENPVVVKGYETRVNNKWIWSGGYLEGDRYKLPHKLGDEYRVGNPLADIYRPFIEDGTLSSQLPDFDLKEFHQLYFETTYWYGNRDRIHQIYVRNGIHVPNIVPHRTVTRRSGDSLWLTVPDTKEGKIGTAIKSQIRVSGDWWLVGADFSTQEMNIAALLSDWWLGSLGSNSFSIAVLEGSKEAGTDMHTLLAKRFGIPRGTAKSLNFAGLYNCGVKRYSTVLKQEARDVSNPELLAKEILTSKRGEVILRGADLDWVKYRFAQLGYPTDRLDRWHFNRHNLYLGGTDSIYYNAIASRLAEETPRTPLLDCRMPRWLEAANRQGSEFMTCANWNIQSTGVDILCLFLVLVDYLKTQQNLTFTYVVSRHDEVWYRCHESEIPQLVNIMQLAHLGVWASLASKLGIKNLPENLCLFPEINVDKVLRKEVTMDVWDGFGNPLNPGYYVKSSAFLGEPKC